MASRFWAASSSEDEDDDYSSDDNVVSTNVRPAASRWAVDSESESEDEVRVVKSAKDKAFEKLEKSCTLMKNYIKINDWSSILNEFDAILKQLDKSKNIIGQQGHPRFYIRALVQLDDAVSDLHKDKPAQKKMSKDNNKAFIRVKGKLKRHTEEMQQKIDDFRANPDESEESEDESSQDEESSEEESDSEEESESDSDEESEEEKAKAESEDSDDWPSESESSSSSDSDTGELKGRAKWLKTATVKVSSKKDKGPKVQKVQKDRARRLSLELEKKATEEDLNLTPVQFDFKLKETVAGRGKKGTEQVEQLAQLRKLAFYSRKLGVAREIMALMHLVGAVVFDQANKIDKIISTDLWKAAKVDLTRVLDLLEQNPGFVLKPLTDEDRADIMKAGRGELKEEEIEKVQLPEAGETGVVTVSGDLASYVDRLCDEYVKSLQQTDPHTSEYISRLIDEGPLVHLAGRVQQQCVKNNDLQGAADLALLQLELEYYKHDTIAKAVHGAHVRYQKLGDTSFFHPACSSTASKQPVGNFDKIHPAAISGLPTCDVPDIFPEADIKKLCVFVYKHGDDRAKTRAMICHIYHHALHDRFSEARDLLLMSHLQDTISLTDVSTQILFNRMMAQLGICAFRTGLMSEAHSCLMEICTGSRTKELLAQGIQSSRYTEKNTQQEKIEKRRQTPYHMHINMELLECCHLTAAMLLEIPNMAAEAWDSRRHVISKTFRRYLEYYDRQVFAGPPENTRDHVIAAAKALSRGSWKKAQNLILGLPLWDLLPGAGVSKRVKEMVGHQIQVEGLRTYLLAFSSEYDSISLPQLCDMFALPIKTGHSVVSKMMINEELPAAWDQHTQCIVMHKIQRTKLQQLALQFVEKTATMVDNNERLLDARGANLKTDDWNRRSGKDGSSKTGKKGPKKEVKRW